MREVRDFFDKLYFSESVLGPARLGDTNLRVAVSGLFLLAGHPLESEGSGPYVGDLVFEGVVDSRRTITEYIGDSRKPEGFKPPREMVDDVRIDPTINTADLHEFGFEGYQESPSAWIDNWIVRAKSFRFEVH